MTEKHPLRPPPRAAQPAIPSAGAGLRLWTGFVLSLETLLPLAWPAIAVALVFVALAGFGVLPALPGWLHLLVLILFAAAFAALAWRGLARWRPVGHAAVLRRLERDAGLVDRPLASQFDAPAGADPLQAALWARHQARLRAAVGPLAAGWPDPGLARRDPLALRGFLILVALLSVAVAGGGFSDRLRAAVSPDARLVPPSRLDAWITPPEYTGLPPVQLTGTARPVDAVISVPAGSRLELKAAGGWGQPVAHLPKGEQAMPPAGDGHALTVTLTESGRLAVRQWWRVLGDWRIEVSADAKPTIALAQPPAATARAATRLSVEGTDDYGILRVTGRLAGASDAAPPADAPWLKPVEFELPLVSAPARVLKQTFFQDWAASPLAGQAVTLTLIARDQAGQESVPATADFTLPERAFRDPVAKAVIAQRRRLMLSPDERQDVAHQLAVIAEKQDAYGRRIVPYLALKVAVSRLLGPRDETTLPTVFQLLWEAALDLDGGGSGQALDRMREAQEKLQRALADPKTGAEEMDRLTEEFRQAMRQYMQELGREMREKLARGEPVPIIDPSKPGQVLSDDSINQMIQQLRDLNDGGSREEAQRMLDQMRQMMETLQSGMDGQLTPLDNETAEAMKDLNKIRELEERLRDAVKGGDPASQPPGEPQDGQTQSGQPQAGQEQSGQTSSGQDQGGESPGGEGQASEGQSGGGQAGGAQGGQDGALATQQGLRKTLGRVMSTLTGKLGDIPPGLGQAELDMRRAEQALRQGDRPGAAAAMDDAVRHLSQGQSQAMQSMGAGMMIGLMPQGMLPEDGRDPFGREPDGLGRSLGLNGPKIPTAPDRQRAREILDELRRRSGDAERPQTELDYLQRLLKRF